MMTQIKLFINSLRHFVQNSKIIQKHQMRRSDFIFDSVQLMYYKCHKVCFKRDGSHIDCPDWIQNKKATINPKNEDDKCFQ